MFTEITISFSLIVVLFIIMGILMWKTEKKFREELKKIEEELKKIEEESERSLKKLEEIEVRWRKGEITAEEAKNLLNCESNKFKAFINNYERN